MNKDITLTLIANAGILIEYDGTGILVDGVHHDATSRFSPVSRVDLLHMRLGKQAFKTLDYLFFSHEHSDHFSPLYVTELIHAREIHKVFLPKAASPSPELGLLCNHLRKKSVEADILSLQPGEFAPFQLGPNITGRIIATRHMGPQYQSVINYCYLFDLSGVTLLFTGDGDFVREYYEAALSGIELDLVFVNPLFYQHPQGQKLINTLFTPKHLVVYHLPFPEDDTMGLGSMVERSKQRFQCTERHTHIFQAEKQSLVLHP